MRFSGWRVWWNAHAVSFCGKSARADTPRLSVSRPVKRVTKARPSYEVSTRFGAPGDRSRSCWAVSFSTSTIGPPQQGQRQVARVAVLTGSTTDELESAEVVSNCWHKGNSFERRRLARKPKLRMRTKPRGNTCRKNRRRNSSAGMVIFRLRLPWA